MFKKWCLFLVDKKDVCIVIPVFNEEKIIKDVIYEIIKNGYENIVVVNDGSIDGTKEILQNLENKNKIIFIDNDKNEGVGKATLIGLRYTFVKNYNYVITIDGDGQHDPKDIERILKGLKYNDVVIGSRILDKDEHLKMPFVKKIGNYGLSVLTYLLGGYYISDSQSGMRGFNKKSLNVLINTLLSNKYEISSEVIILSKKFHLALKEVPIKTIYTEYSKSKGTNVLTGFKIVFNILKMKVGCYK